MRPPERVAVCSSCKCPRKRHSFPFLHPIPTKIQNAPLKRRMYLFGTSAVYSEYRTFAYLEDDFTPNSSSRFWINDALVAAANWLKQHNPFLRSYSCLLDLLDPLDQSVSNCISHIRWWLMMILHLLTILCYPWYPWLWTTQTWMLIFFDISKFYLNLKKRFHIRINSFFSSHHSLQNIRLCSFLVSFQMGQDTIVMKDLNQDDAKREEIYSKYIKQRILNIDPWFRLHHRWMV